MIIHVYMMCFNEEVLMPYFLRHYGSFADHIFVFDHYSDDKTVEIVKAFPKTTITPFGIAGKFDDTILLNLKNEAYKSSRGKADWVMIVDIDEFLYHPNLVYLLKNYKDKGITFPKITGFDMISDEVPTHPGQIYETIKEGVHDTMFSKRAVFNPSIDIKYFPGAHKCFPSGNIIESEKDDVKLLHYRFLSPYFIVNRIELRTSRLSEENIKKKWSVVKCAEGETLRERLLKTYVERRAARTKVI